MAFADPAETVYAPSGHARQYLDDFNRPDAPPSATALGTNWVFTGPSVPSISGGKAVLPQGANIRWVPQSNAVGGGYAEAMFSWKAPLSSGEPWVRWNAQVIIKYFDPVTKQEIAYIGKLFVQENPAFPEDPTQSIKELRLIVGTQPVKSTPITLPLTRDSGPFWIRLEVFEDPVLRTRRLVLSAAWGQSCSRQQTLEQCQLDNMPKAEYTDPVAVGVSVPGIREHAVMVHHSDYYLYQFNAGAIGRSRRFGLDSTANVAFGDLLEYRDLPRFTWCAWIKHTDTTPIQSIAKKGARTLFAVGQGPPTASHFALVDAAAVPALSVAQSPLPTVDVWKFLCVTYDDLGDRRSRLFVDGVEVAYGNSQWATGGSKLENGALIIGNGYSGSGFWGLRGLMAHFHLFDRVLTTADMLGLRSGPNSLTPVAKLYCPLTGVTPEPGGGTNFGVVTGAPASLDGPYNSLLTRVSFRGESAPP